MNDRIQLRIQESYMGLRSSEKKVADYILGYRGDYESLRIAGISEKAGVSQPTIIRFVKAMGYGGFKEFKNALIRSQAWEAGRRESEEGGEEEYLYGFRLLPEDGLDVIPGKVIATSIQMLKETLRSISQKEYEGAVDAILRARRILICGVEESAVPAKDLQIKLMYLGIDCCRYEDYYLQSVSAQSLEKGDLAVGISYSGCSAMAVEVMKRAKKAGAETLVITNFENARISRYGDHVLCTSSRQFLYGNAIFSRITQLAIVDMLYMGVLNRDYENRRKKLKQNSRVAVEQAYGPMGEEGDENL